MTEQRATTQDIRPLEIAIVNLMPAKVATEVQLLRLLSNTPLQVRATLVAMGGHVPTHTSLSHMEAFYEDSRSILERRFDGIIVTGAPVETLPFTDVDYWDELTTLFEWSRTHVYRSLFICWGANAGLHYFHGIEKHILEKKLSGVFPLSCHDNTSRLLLGLDDPFFMPQSRFATALVEDVKAAGLRLIAGSPETGAVVTATPDHRQVFVTGHFEYDLDTLDKEYHRDLEAGLDVDPPVNYYTDNDPTKPPLLRWRTYAHQFFANWLNHYVYQETPYDLSYL
jgi:homoserine O-succinyltransferase